MTIEELKKYFPTLAETYSRHELNAILGTVASSYAGPANLTTDPGEHKSGRWFKIKDAGKYVNFLGQTGSPLETIVKPAGYTMANGSIYDNGSYYELDYSFEQVPGGVDFVNENPQLVNMWDGSYQSNLYIAPTTQPFNYSTAGNIVANTNSRITYPIAVQPSTKYTFRNLKNISSTPQFMRFEDANHVKLAGTDGYFEIADGTDDFTITTPVNCYFVLLTIRRGNTTPLTPIMQQGEAIVVPSDNYGARTKGLIKDGATTPILAKFLNGETIIISDGTGDRSPVSRAQLLAATAGLMNQATADTRYMQGVAKVQNPTLVNLWDGTYRTGYFINPATEPYNYAIAGDLFVNTNSRVSYPIPVLPNTKYTFRNLNSSQLHAFIRIEDSNNVKLAGADGYYEIMQNDVDFTITTPANAAYIVLPLRRSSQAIQSPIMQQGTTIVLPSDNYGKRMSAIIQSGVEIPLLAKFLDDTTRIIKESTDDAAPVSQRQLNERLNGVSTLQTLTFQNSDSINISGCSYEAGHGTSIQMKHWIALASAFTNYVLHNFGVSGDRTTDVTRRIRLNTATQFTSRGKGAKDMKARFTTVQNIGNELLNYLPSNSDGFEEEWKELALAIQAIGSFPLFTTDWTIKNPMSAIMMKNMADQFGSYFHDIGTVGDKMQATSVPAIRWNGTHPDTRGQISTFNEFKYFLDRLPKPRKAIKAFRPRTAFLATAPGIQLYNYDSMLQRAVLFSEIGIGQASISDANVAYMDRTNSIDTVSVATNRTDEYIELMTGNPVSFNTVALFELVLDRINVTSLNLYVKMAQNTNALFYIKNNLVLSTYAPTAKTAVYANITVAKEVFDAANVNAGDTYTSPLFVDGSGNPLPLTMKGKYVSRSTGYMIGFTAATAATTRTFAADGVFTRTSGTGAASITGQINEGLSSASFEFLSGIGKAEGALTDFTSKAAYNATTGYYKITLTEADLAGLLKYDNVKLFVNVPATTFIISDMYVEYGGGVAKHEEKVWYRPKQTYKELLAANTFDNTFNTTGGWSAGTGIVLASASAEYRDYPTIKYGSQSASSVNHLVLPFGDNNLPSMLSRAVTLTPKYGARKAIIRAVCRIFPKLQRPDIGETAETTALQLITKDSYDFGTLCVAIQGQRSQSGSGDGLNSATFVVSKQLVGIGWMEAYFEFDLPPFQNAFNLRIYRDMADVTGINGYLNHTFDMQLWSVSIQVEGE